MATAPVTVTETINAPAEVIWSLITDVTRMGEWSPETTAAKWLGGATGAVVGAKFKGDNTNGAKKWSTTCKVTAAENGKSFGFTVRSAMVPGIDLADWLYEMTAGPNGSVTVKETWTDHRPGLLVMPGAVVTGVKDRSTHNRAGMVTTLANLKLASEKLAATN